MPPRHYNPLPMFGLRFRLSRTAQAVAYIVQRAGAKGVEAFRIAPLLYMSDVIGREYLGRPITDIQWTREMLESGAPLAQRALSPTTPEAVSGSTPSAPPAPESNP